MSIKNVYQGKVINFQFDLRLGLPKYEAKDILSIV